MEILEEQNARKQKRIKSLVMTGQLTLNKVGKKHEYNEDEFLKLVCKKGQIPIYANDMNDEPYIYYVTKGLTSKKCDYALRNYNIQKYMDMENYWTCFKMVDVFISEINEMAEKFNIPKEEIKDALTNLWRKHNKK